jgi:hypothetical protein
MTECDLLAIDATFSTVHVVKYELDDTGSLTSFTTSEHFLLDSYFNPQTGRHILWVRSSESKWRVYLYGQYFDGELNSREVGARRADELHACLRALHDHLTVQVILG